MKKQTLVDRNPDQKSAPSLSAIRRQLTYLQEEASEFGCPEISLFLGCALLAIDELKQKDPAHVLMFRSI